jgi:hypothetical protein
LDWRVHGAPWRRCARSISVGPSLLLSAVYGQRRRRNALRAPPLFLPMIGHLPDSLDPAPKETGRLTAPGVQVCGVFWQPVFMARLIRARHRPWIRQHGMPAALRIGRRPTLWCRRRPGRRRRLPVQIRQLVAKPRGRRRSLVGSGEHSGLMGPEPPTPSSPGRSDQDRTVPATPADRRSPC